jgi:hypothetical protein
VANQSASLPVGEAVGDLASWQSSQSASQQVGHSGTHVPMNVKPVGARTLSVRTAAQLVLLHGLSALVGGRGHDPGNGSIFPLIFVAPKNNFSMSWWSG